MKALTREWSRPCEHISDCATEVPTSNNTSARSRGGHQGQGERCESRTSQHTQFCVISYPELGTEEGELHFQSNGEIRSSHQPLHTHSHSWELLRRLPWEVMISDLSSVFYLKVCIFFKEKTASF